MSDINNNLERLSSLIIEMQTNERLRKAGGKEGRKLRREYNRLQFKVDRQISRQIKKNAK
jgi:hypothetical protein